jgi:hypothetical protein
MSGCSGWVSVPFGPLTVTTLPGSIVTVTPFGTGMGDFPIRDIVVSPDVMRDT